MMRLLVGDSNNLMVVGDPDQSIYGWRGANYATIMNFERDFPNARVTLLEQNYRSTAMILDASNQLIRHNKNRREKNLRTNREEGQKVGVWYLRDEKAEAEALAREIVGLTAAYHYGDIAVLYRMNALSRVLEQALIEAGIPYRIVRGTSFYDRKEVRDVVAFMRLAVNPWDLVALNRVGNLPARALGPKSLEKLGAWMRENAKGAAEDVWGTVKAKKGGLTGKAAEGAVQLADHMLTLLARHGRFDLKLTCRGDTSVDDHHSVEDIGICLGRAFAQALGEKRGISRYGFCALPMDEALILAAVDFSGRACLGYDPPPRAQKVGTFDTELVQEFGRLSHAAPVVLCICVVWPAATRTTSSRARSRRRPAVCVRPWPSRPIAPTRSRPARGCSD